MIRNKTIKFNLDKPEERALWEWLEKLPHGKFSETTKYYWDAKRQADEILRPIMEEEGNEAQ